MPGSDLWRLRHLAGRVQEVYGSEGVEGVVRRTRLWMSRRRVLKGAEGLPDGPVAASASHWPVSVLSVAEHSIPQCYHYRVEQKAQIFEDLGVPFATVGLEDPLEAISRLQLASVLIIYRLADSAALRRLIEEARRLGIPIVFEVDDVVYRRELAASNPNLASLPATLREAVIAGTDGYAAALGAADVNLASTAVLADDMTSMNHRPALVVSNGIDDHMLEIARGLRRPDDPGGHPVALYGSGSRAHDHDFAVAAPGIAAWLRAHPDACLHLLGPVRMPEVLQPLAGQVIQTRDALPYEQYLELLAASTVCLAPLVDAPFNSFKSHVKYLEAALVGTPLIASPTVYADYVVDGVTALIADDSSWGEALSRLTEDPTLRRSLTHAAREDVRRWELRREPTSQMRALLDAVAPAWREQ